VDDGPLAGLGPAARACLSAGLTDEPVPLDPEALTLEGDLLVAESMAPVALRLAETTPGTERETVDRYHRVTLRMQLRSMTIEVATRRVLSALADRAIPLVVIKGPAVLPYQPPGWARSYSDIDLLVPVARFDQVVAACEKEGFTDPASTPPWPWFNTSCKEGVNFCSADGGNVDVHHHVPPWVFGAKLTPERVLAASVPGEVAGRPVHLASAEHCLVIAALHVLNDLWKGRIGLVSWRDIAVLLRHLGGDRAAAAFDEVGLRWLLTLVAGSLSRTIPELGLPVIGPQRMPVSVRGRMAALGWDSDSHLTHLRATFAARLPASRAALFVAGCMVPKPQYVREYFGSYVKYWGHLVEESLSTLHGEDPRMNSIRMTKIEHEGSTGGGRSP
jgi:hypothetical protein